MSNTPTLGIDKKVTKKARRLLRSYNNSKDNTVKAAFATKIKEVANGFTPELKKNYSEKYGFQF